MTKPLTLDQKIEYLSETPLFKDVPKDAFKTIASVAKERNFQMGQVLALEGEAGDTMFIIIQGNIKVTIKNDSGQEVELAIRGPGDHLGEMAILSEIPRTATLTTITTGAYLEISKDDFHSILTSHLQISLGIIRELINRLHEGDRRLLK